MFVEGVVKIFFRCVFLRMINTCVHSVLMEMSGCDGILFEAASLLNAVTLQIQLVIAHIAVEIFDPSNYPNPEKKGHFLPFGPVSESWNVHMNWRVVGISHSTSLIEVMYHKKISMSTNCR